MQRQQPRSVIIVTIRSCLENGWKESIFQIKSFLLKFPKRKRKTFLRVCWKEKICSKGIFNKKQIECLSGVYFPYWIYDAKLQGKLQGEGKKIRVWRTGDTEYTETKFYHVEREGEVNLKNLAENALQKANVQLVKGVLPYQFNEMKDFNMGYLSGFMAEKRDIEQKAVEGNMQATMKTQQKNSCGNLFRDTMRYRSTHSG